MTAVDVTAAILRRKPDMRARQWFPVKTDRAMDSAERWPISAAAAGNSNEAEEDYHDPGVPEYRPRITADLFVPHFSILSYEARQPKNV